MTQEQFDIITKGLVNPERVKVAVTPEYDLLLSAENTNDTMEWFKINSESLESNLRHQKLKWAYAIETCPDNQPFIYMLISPNMSTWKANKLILRAKNTLPEDRSIFASEGPFKAFKIDNFDLTPTTLLDELFTKYASDVLRVSVV